MTRTNQAGLMPERASRPKDPVGLGWVGPTIRMGHARRPVRTEQARDLDGASELDDPNKLSCVGLKDTSFRKINLNFFCKKWILDFELDQNIWTRFKS